MIRVQSFTTVEEMLDAMDNQRHLADANTQAWQEAGAVPGAKFLRVVPELKTIIYGEILDPVQTADEDEVAYQKELWAQPHMRYFRFSRCYSKMCPEGELGDTHVSSIAMFVTETMFNRFKSLGWPDHPQAVAEIVAPTSRGGHA